MASIKNEMRGVTVTPPAPYSNPETHLTSPIVLENNGADMLETSRDTSAVNPHIRFTQNPYNHSSFHQGANR